LGDAQYAAGRTERKPDLAANGRNLLADTVVPAMPTLGNLARAAPFVGASRGDADFDLGLESYFPAFEACTGEAIDRDRPGVGADLAARAKEYRIGGDPRQEPALGATACLGCHQQ